MRATGLLFILACATSPSVPAQTALEGNDAQKVRALEQAWFEGQSRGDKRAPDQPFDNALVYIENGRSMTKQEDLSEIRSARPHPQQIVMRAVTVRTFGNTAVVVGIYSRKSVKMGRPSCGDGALSIPGRPRREVGCWSRRWRPYRSKWKVCRMVIAA
jgi:Domain of unknown function (DUF4440)